jgi:hypothetical protein
MRTVSSRTLGLIALTFAAGCGIENSIVGGRCRDGMVLSGGSCVEPAAITLITPVAPPEPPDPIVTLVAPPPNQYLPIHVPTLVPPLPTELFPEVPVPELVDPPPVELHCTAPLVACRGVCISVQSDGANCGACGKICPSNICIAGECQGATPGDVVLIGHDFTDATAGSAQTKVLINALSIPTTDPIRILSFEDGASATAVAQMKGLASGAITNRAVSFTRAGSASSLTSATLAAAYDIIVIHDASAVDPITTGASWAGSLGTFAAKGGVIVALDDGGSPMPQLMSSAALLTVGSHTVLPAGAHLMVSAAADVVGAQVLSPYAGFGAAVSFQGLPAQSPDLTWVVRVKLGNGSPGDAVVVHRIVR